MDVPAKEAAKPVGAIAATGPQQKEELTAPSPTTQRATDSEVGAKQEVTEDAHKVKFELGDEVDDDEVLSRAEEIVAELNASTSDLEAIAATAPRKKEELTAKSPTTQRATDSEGGAKQEVTEDAHKVKFELGDEMDDDEVFSRAEEIVAELNASTSDLSASTSDLSASTSELSQNASAAPSSLRSIARSQEMARNIAKLVRPRPMSKSMSAGVFTSLDKTRSPETSRIPTRVADKDSRVGLPPGQPRPSSWPGVSPRPYHRSASVAGMTALSTLHEQQRKVSTIPLVWTPHGSLVTVKKPIGELLPKHTAEERAALACQPAPHDPHFKKRTQTMGLRPIPAFKKMEKVPEIMQHETAEGMTLVLAVPTRHESQSVARAGRARDTYVTAPYGETYILSARCPKTGIDRYIKFIV